MLCTIRLGDRLESSPPFTKGVANDADFAKKRRSAAGRAGGARAAASHIRSSPLAKVPLGASGQSVHRRTREKPIEFLGDLSHERISGLEQLRRTGHHCCDRKHERGDVRPYLGTRRGLQRRLWEHWLARRRANLDHRRQPHHAGHREGQ